ncbi:MAG: hypothetical protein D6788_00135 [Planctomycetota bacterium]|nr:MAG: hypothetical protein D6788_00135 [Planctomycetota bacterium]
MMRKSWRIAGSVLGCALPLVLATAAQAQRVEGKADPAFKRVAPEPAVGGMTVEAMLAEQQRLHNWIMTQIPDGAAQRVVRVELTERDRKDLETPYIPGSLTPMRVGVVKPLADPIGFSSGKLLDARGVRGKKSALGAFERTGDGGFVWTVTLSSPGAVALRVHFENFSLPPTAEAYVFNRDGEARGPYLGKGPDGSGEFWSHSVASSSVSVMVRQFGPLAPEDLRGLSLRITEVAHVAIDFPRGLGAGSVASFCTYNAPCVENNACTSDPAVNNAEGAVAKMRWISGAFIYICSGGLVADTDPNTQIPYFLTANHCLSKNKDAKNLETFFLYTASCGTTNCPGSFDRPFDPPSTLGATVAATGRDGDYTLLELNDPPPAGTTFLGWNNAPIAFNDGAVLHRISHPQGAPQAYSQHVVDTQAGTCTGVPRGSWIYSNDVIGATEGGSSGSPVVNSAGEVVGQLTGCCGFNCNDVCDSASNSTIDGALAAYWSAVAPFLDPAPCTPSTEICDDGVDNDCDGAVDCNDSDCTNDPACTGGGCNLGQRGDPCSTGADCCSGVCKRNGTCR